MSIAVSAEIRPSVLLRWLSFCFGVALGVSAFLLWQAGQGEVGDVRPTLAIVCAITSLRFILFPSSTRKSFRIDVTGTGQILLTDTEGALLAQARHSDLGRSEVVQLLGDSTLWSSFMLLRLRAESGRITELTILPDCMDREAYRALSIACRWVAAQRTSNQRAQPTPTDPSD
jgi:hypothetical protein